MRRLAIFVVVTLVVGCGISTSPTKDNTENSSNPASGAKPASDKAEAQFKGKPTSFWARQLQDKDVASRMEAAKALEAIGPAGKSAVADLKVALKERAWEVLARGGRFSNRTFTSVSETIGSAPPKEPTKDEVIAKLRQELAQKAKQYAELNAQNEKQLESIFGDPCLRALTMALLAIDRSELEAMAGDVPIVNSTNTFEKVSNKIRE